MKEEGGIWIEKSVRNYVEGLPLITVISISYNAGLSSVKNTIRSVLAQNYPNIEYIVIDNCSIDGSQMLFKHFEKRIDYWLSEKDSGPYDAMNKGLGMAHGDWIVFMNMGDTFPDNPNHLSQLIKEVKSEDVQILYGNTQIKKLGFSYLKKFKTEIRHNLYFGILRLNHQSLMARAELFKSIGVFDSHRFKIKADAYWFNKVYYQIGAGAFQYIDSVFAIYGEDGLSSHTDSFPKMYAEDKLILNEFGSLFQKILNFFRYRVIMIRVFLFNVLRKNTSLYTIYRKVKYSNCQPATHIK